MTSRTLLKLVICLLLFGAMAAYVLTKQSPPKAAGSPAAFIAPDLQGKINDVARIEVTSAGKTAVIERSKEGAGWGAPSRSGFPVDSSKVKEAVLSVSSLKAAETRTSKPDNYPRLGVEDTTAPGAASKLVTLKDASGTTLASVIIGKTAEGPRSGGRSWVYARRAGDAQAYLAEGGADPGVAIPADDLAWLSRDVVQLDSTRVKGAIIVQPDGAELVVSRSLPTDANYTLANLPPGRELSSPSATTQVATALSFVNFDDVASASTLADAQPAGSAEFRTFDGLVVRLAYLTKDGKTWTRMSAAAEPAEAALTEDQMKSTPTLKKPEDVAKEAADLDKRFAGWAFALPDFKLKQIRQTTEGLLKPLPSKNVPPTDPNGEVPLVVPEAGGK